MKRYILTKVVDYVCEHCNAIKDPKKMMEPCERCGSTDIVVKVIEVQPLEDIRQHGAI